MNNKILDLYKTADEKTKNKIEAFWPELFPKSIIERVTTLEDACIEIGEDINHLFDGCPDDYKKAEKAIETFAKAMREGRPANECQCYPYFNRSSGGGFSFDDFVVGYGCSLVGARLRVDGSDKAIHMGKCMESYYKTYLLGK